MTRAGLAARLEKNWHLLLLAGTVLGAFGYRWISPNERIATIEKRQDAMSDSVSSGAKRLDRLEIAVTILAISACRDTTVRGYEAIQLKCYELRQR